MKLTLMARSLQRGIVNNAMYVPNAITDKVLSKRLPDQYLRLPVPGDDNRVLINKPFDRNAYLKKIDKYNERKKN